MPDAHSPFVILLLSLLAGAIRVSTPYLFVSLGECLTEKGGRVNLGLEGILVSGAMSGYAASLLTGSPWVGVLAAGLVGLLLGCLHGLVCSLPRVSDIAFGIALMLLGTGLAFYLGKPFIEPQAPMSANRSISAHGRRSPQLHNALHINPLFVIGVVLAFVLQWGCATTRWGMALAPRRRSRRDARAMGYPLTRMRIVATAVGGFVAGIGGAYLSLVYPGSWNEGLSSGQGTDGRRAGDFRALAAFAMPVGRAAFRCGRRTRPGVAGDRRDERLLPLNAAPYVLTLAIMIVNCRPDRTLAGAPGELSLTR